MGQPERTGAVNRRYETKTLSAVMERLYFEGWQELGDAMYRSKLRLLRTTPTGRLMAWIYVETWADANLLSAATWTHTGEDQPGALDRAMAAAVAEWPRINFVLAARYEQAA